MEITITINGKPVQVTVDDAAIREVMSEKASEKMTGYERNNGGQYYYQATDGHVDSDNDDSHPADDRRYQTGNYYTFKEVADNNVRADSLMRNLRRFAAEHGGGLCPKSREMWMEAYVIRYDGNLRASDVVNFWPTTWGVLFVSKKSCEAAIEAFRNELTWYFTEYDPMPEGWWES